jgi:hypothetical protein
MPRKGSLVVRFTNMINRIIGLLLSFTAVAFILGAMYVDIWFGIVMLVVITGGLAILQNKYAKKEAGEGAQKGMGPGTKSFLRGVAIFVTVMLASLANAIRVGKSINKDNQRDPNEKVSGK